MKRGDCCNIPVTSGALYAVGRRLVCGSCLVAENAALKRRVRQTRDNLRHMATCINAAAEQREAKLRGALAHVVAEIGGLTTSGMRHPIDSNGPWARTERACAVARAALEGHGDYVPRADLDAANAKLTEERQKTRERWLVLCDALVERSDITLDALAQLAGSLGIELMATDAVWVNAWQQRCVPDEVLLRALNARGYVAARNGLVFPQTGNDERFRRTPSFCPHCNNLPYDGATLACPECGIDRHGVGHGAG